MSQGPEEGGLAVIGAGLGRTGTNSLKLALETIFQKKCYHLKEIYLHRHEDMEKWIKLEESLKRSSTGKLDKELCEKIFSGYGAAVDHPACVYYKELLELYPNAKVILTIRDPEIWLAGARSTILPRNVANPKSWAFHFVRRVLGLKSFRKMYLASWKRAFGDSIDFTDDTAVLKGFVNWTEQVKKNVPSDRLLVYDISKGWEPLCQFLRVPVPDSPFPHVNEYEEMRRLVRIERRADAIIEWGAPALLLILLAVFFIQLFRYIH
ncbi:unnamed protein product [Calicophoron daubneyi]|uniref:NAD dependent epimerase/dehydratase n=1 Tax=Calicophoron daubneyi TaxID=300641 RepID=A0AAV2TL07_CALDB